MDEVKSRRFIKQFNSFSPTDQRHLSKAIKRVLKDPTLDSYKRSYLTPYRQEHPSDPQHTIFFEEIGKENSVFFVWLNDYSCLHSTRKATEDPCLKEFDKLRQSGHLEAFNKDYHLGKLTINPRVTSPHYLKFELIDYEIYFHILTDEESYYSLSIGYHDIKSEDNINFTNHTFKLFLNSFAEHLQKQSQQFEFRIEPNLFNQDLLQLLEENYNPNQWNTDQDTEYHYLKLK
jgi:hypothetical protein